MKNKLLVFSLLFAFVIIGIAAIKPARALHDNLKVLPKDISDADLDSVMSGFEKALNVECEACHARNKANPSQMDYASDDKPEKEITRKMMIVTEMINKELFNYTISYKANEVMGVSCKTCHDGFARPELKYEKKE